jgi:hypothetical protein
VSTPRYGNRATTSAAICSIVSLSIPRGSHRPRAASATKSLVSRRVSERANPPSHLNSSSAPLERGFPFGVLMGAQVLLTRKEGRRAYAAPTHQRS